jgi:hypothetical protein
MVHFPSASWADEDFKVQAIGQTSKRFNTQASFALHEQAELRLADARTPCDSIACHVVLTNEGSNLVVHNHVWNPIEHLSKSKLFKWRDQHWAQ